MNNKTINYKMGKMKIFIVGSGKLANALLTTDLSVESCEIMKWESKYQTFDDFPTEKIISVRDRKIQQNQIGIPEEFLNKHAWHKIVIRDGNDEVTIQTKVLGHDSYAKGVKTIIEMVLKTTLENKRYSILELFKVWLHIPMRYIGNIISHIYQRLYQKSFYR